ncbi:hypothetical protein F2Q70_00021940 [Brassica cretica]|uniref:Aspartic peptidase DDI1-type domain-containing protein n=1 Tax=Brassica cretica TaxID=69181 RepID=A0A8S9GZE6_BRACR|nr:hypothetical protein F2Q70_00021940 [Brassica cretica]
MTPTESTASYNVVRILTHEEFASKHPHPPNPENVRIARRADTTIDRHGESTIARQTEASIDRQPPAPIDRRAPVTYRVQIPKIDVARLNALRPKSKPSENPPETVRTPSDDGQDPMEEDRVRTGITLRRRNEKVAKHLKRGDDEKEKENFRKRVFRIPIDKPFEDTYYTHRLWMFFRENREKEEDIKRMFCEAREKMRMRRITLKKKSDPGKFVIPCTVNGGAFTRTIHFCGLFPKELMRNCERPRGADCQEATYASRRINDPGIIGACHCGAWYETEYSAWIETHTVTSIDSSHQKSTDTPHEESVNSCPDDWENDYYNPTIAAYTKQHMHTEEYDEDYEDERATEYKTILDDQDTLLYHSSWKRNAPSIDIPGSPSIDTQPPRRNRKRTSTDITNYSSIDAEVNRVREGDYSIGSWADDHHHERYAVETTIYEPGKDELHEAKHPHPPSPDNVRIARRADTSIDRHGESTIARQRDVNIDGQPPAPIDQRAPITYRVQMPKIDVARRNALRPTPKPSENPPETVRTPSDDGEDPMEEDRVPTGRTLRRRKEKVAKHLKRGANEKERGANEKEKENFRKRVFRIPLDKPFEETYYTHRLWMFFRETREKEEDIKRMFCETREKMRMRITLKKKSDPGQFAIPCTVKGIEFPHALCDTGASASILPRVMADHLGLQVEPSQELFTFVDCSQSNLGGIVRDLVPVDFHALDIKLNWNSSLLLGRAFLSTVGAVCNLQTN